MTPPELSGINTISKQVLYPTRPYNLCCLTRLLPPHTISPPSEAHHTSASLSTLKMILVMDVESSLLHFASWQKPRRQRCHIESGGTLIGLFKLPLRQVRWNVDALNVVASG